MSNTVIKVTITDAHATQRVDNYLLTACKGVPKTRIYRALRSGEVRINGKRVKPSYRLQLHDEVRIPPLRVATPSATPVPAPRLLTDLAARIVMETKHFIIVDKPAGMPVHGGSGISTGFIEAMRVLRPDCRFLELAHRLDRETSGCLVLAKKRAALTYLHEQWRQQSVKKRYWTLLKGVWPGKTVTKVTVPLRKNQLQSGERMVVVDEQAGKPATTIFYPLRQYADATLVEAVIVTGRTHQIRVHAAHIGHPIAGDDKYGDIKFNQQLRAVGLRRLFLHAISIYCELPAVIEEQLGLCVPLATELQSCLQQLAR